MFLWPLACDKDFMVELPPSLVKVHPGSRLLCSRNSTVVVVGSLFFSCLRPTGLDIVSHERHCADKIFMAGAQCDLRGCVPERWAPVSAAMHYLKTIIQRRLQGTPFVTASGTLSVYEQTERRQKRSGRWPGGQVQTETLCQRESEGQNLQGLLSRHGKP